MAKMNIENVVASTYLGQELDLNKIEDALEGAEYNPQQFPGLVYRLKEPKTATLIFRSGKVVCTGAKCREDVKVAISKVAKDLEKADVHITIEPKIEVQNIVASSDLEQEINLNTVAITLGLEKVEYEPEQFPGLVVRARAVPRTGLQTGRPQGRGPPVRIRQDGLHRRQGSRGCDPRGRQDRRRAQVREPDGLKTASLEGTPLSNPFTSPDSFVTVLAPLMHLDSFRRVLTSCHPHGFDSHVQRTSGPET